VADDPTVSDESSGDGAAPALAEWTVAGALIVGPEGVLLVENLRRNGHTDWTPPGGVIEVAGGESVLEGLTREVAEETGLVVGEWEGPIYEVVASAPDMGWRMRVEVHRALSWGGDLRIGEDPDGIVVGATWVDVAGCVGRLEGAHRWVREPLIDWLRPDVAVTETRYRYRIAGRHLSDAVIERLVE